MEAPAPEVSAGVLLALTGFALVLRPESLRVVRLAADRLEGMIAAVSGFLAQGRRPPRGA